MTPRIVSALIASLLVAASTQLPLWSMQMRAPQYPKVGNFGSRGKMDKCTYCAGGPEADGSKEEYEKYGANRLSPRTPAKVP